MKKKLGVVLVFGLLMNIPFYSVNTKPNPEEITKQITQVVNSVFGIIEISLPEKERNTQAFQVVKALLNLASSITATVPKLIKDIPDFPKKIQAPAKELRAELIKVAKMPKDTDEQREIRTKKIEELYAKAVNVLVPIQNILDDFLGMAKLIGPIVGVFDKKTGDEMTTTIELIAQTLYIITKISVGQQNVIKAENPEIKKEVPAPEKVELPDLDI